MCSSTFSAHNMTKNILTITQPKKDENTKSWAQEAISTLEKAKEHKKMLTFVLREIRKQNKGRTPQKI